MKMYFNLNLKASACYSSFMMDLIFLMLLRDMVKPFVKWKCTEDGTVAKYLAVLAVTVTCSEFGMFLYDRRVGGFRVELPPTCLWVWFWAITPYSSISTGRTSPVLLSFTHSSLSLAGSTFWSSWSTGSTVCWTHEGRETMLSILNLCAGMPF